MKVDAEMHRPEIWSNFRSSQLKWTKIESIFLRQYFCCWRKDERKLNLTGACTEPRGKHHHYSPVLTQPGLAQSTSLWLLLFVPAPFWCALSPSHGSAWCVCQWPPIRQRRRFWSSSRWWKVWIYSYPTLPSLLPLLLSKHFLEQGLNGSWKRNANLPQVME